MPVCFLVCTSSKLDCFRYSTMGGKAKIDEKLANPEYKNENVELLNITVNTTIDMRNVWVFMEEAIKHSIDELIVMVTDNITTQVGALTQQIDDLSKEMIIYKESLVMNNAFYM